MNLKRQADLKCQSINILLEKILIFIFLQQLFNALKMKVIKVTLLGSLCKAKSCSSKANKTTPHLYPPLRANTDRMQQVCDASGNELWGQDQTTGFQHSRTK